MDMVNKIINKFIKQPVLALDARCALNLEHLTADLRYENETLARKPGVRQPVIHIPLLLTGRMAPDDSDCSKEKKRNVEPLLSYRKLLS